MDFLFRSPAKINLFLRVLRKRDDGYHDIASLMQSINFYDSLHFVFSDKDSLTCNDPTLSCGPDNFILRALLLFREKTGIREHFHIELEKNIPQQAGLAGGSSNCATTFFALNQICKTNISEATLRLWASQITTDAAFFFSTGTAYYQGAGESVASFEGLSWLMAQKIYLIKPSEGLSTKEIFSNLDLRECSSRDPKEILEGFLANKPFFCNDLEKAAYRLCPSLEHLRKELLLVGFDYLFMTGSGTAHVGLSSAEHKRFPYYSAINRSLDSWY